VRKRIVRSHSAVGHGWYTRILSFIQQQRRHDKASNQPNLVSSRMWHTRHQWHMYIRLAHCKSITKLSPRLSSVCLPRVRSRKLSETGAKFRHLIGNRGRRARTWRQILHRKQLNTPKSSDFGSVRAYCFAPLAMQLASVAALHFHTVYKIFHSPQIAGPSKLWDSMPPLMPSVPLSEFLQASTLIYFGVDCIDMLCLVHVPLITKYVWQMSIEHALMYSIWRQIIVSCQRQLIIDPQNEAVGLYVSDAGLSSSFYSHAKDDSRQSYTAVRYIISWQNARLSTAIH